MKEPEGYIRKEYPFENPYLHRASWKVQRNKDNVPSFLTAVKDSKSNRTGEGICAALSNMWIVKSIQLGRVAAAKDLGNIHQIAIAQGAYGVMHRSTAPEFKTQISVDKQLMSMFGLKPVSNTGFKKDVGEVSNAVYSEVTAEPSLLSGGGSYYLFGVPRHMIALHLSGQDCHLFDCDVGLYTYKNASTLTGALDNYCEEKYPGDSYLAYRVKME
jgi:hypothetical protein